MSGLHQSLQDLTPKLDFDARFSNHNVMKHCWFSYVAYQMCKAANNSDEDCFLPRRYVESQCVREQVSISISSNF